VDQLKKILSANWGLQQAQLERIASGHTNDSFLVRSMGRRYVLRRSWAGKSLGQVRREETILDHLARREGAPGAPRLLRTLGGASHLVTERRRLHLFEHIEGEPCEARACCEGALAALALLHRDLRTLPAASAGSHLRARYRRVRARGAVKLPAEVTVELPQVLSSICKALSAVPGLNLGLDQWLHGDYHLGNLLCTAGEVAAVVDFDDAGWGPAALELAFGLFALSRLTQAEDRFQFDPALWQRGLDAYGRLDEATAERCRRAPQAELLKLFCADQVLIHLEAAQRGLWRLEPGIGFLPCWSELQSGSSSRQR
jgi:Ser/Thr protein kinase RdoA (MazF antagonist)